MSRLGLLTARTRLTMLVEATKSKGVKDANPSTDIPGDCLKAANAFRDAAKGGEALEVAADGAAKAADALAGTIPEKAKMHAIDVRDAAIKMKDAVDGIYGNFATARQTFYAIALAWDLYAKQPSAAKSASSGVDIKTQSDQEVADGIGFASKNLKVSVKDFLDKAMKASNLLRAAAKKIGLEKGELTDSEKKALIDACFDAKNAADPIFGRSQGIKRRADELLARAEEKAKYEAKKTKKLKVEFDFEDDAELADLDMI